MSARKKPHTTQHKALTVAEVGAKLSELRQQMVELMTVAEKAGGEQLRDLIDCTVGFDDLIAETSLALTNFERRLNKLQRNLGGVQ